jgi:translation initiation factor IF-3
MVQNKSKFRSRRPRINIPLNEHIRARTLQVIDQNGDHLGEISKEEALKIARDAELDLFVVSDKNNGAPIAKILDYGKYKFEQSKKDKGTKKKQGSDYKEVKMGYNIDIGDYNTRLKRAKEFLDKGKKVKLNITLKGREMQHIGRAKDMARKFIDDVMEHGTGEPVPDRIAGRSIIVFILPGADKQKIKKRQEEEAKKELEENAQDSIKQ